jgi:uncharacterized membrane protein YdjX (TVP38/TMEM64 family)
MSWFIIWLYVVIGQLTVLLLLDDEQGVTQFQSAKQSGWWAPYGAAILMVIAWPAADLLLRSFSRTK